MAKQLAAIKLRRKSLTVGKENLSRTYILEPKDHIHVGMPGSIKSCS